jgi:hypothetical protein
MQVLTEEWELLSYPELCASLCALGAMLNAVFSFEFRIPQSTFCN